MKNSSQTQHHISETKRKEEQKLEEIRKKEDAGCRMQEAGSQWNSSRKSENSEFRWDCENFAILAKFSLCELFARLAKFR